MKLIAHYVILFNVFVFLFSIIISTNMLGRALGIAGFLVPRTKFGIEAPI